MPGIVSVDMDFSSEPVMRLACQPEECEFSDLELYYSVDIGDQWLRGSACKSSCGILTIQ